MLLQYLPIAILFIAATAIGVIVVVLGYLFGPRHPSERKGETYKIRDATDRSWYPPDTGAFLHDRSTFYPF